MKLEDTIQAPGALSSGRFFRTGYLPTYGAAAFLLVLIWAGAPGSRVDFSRAWRTASHLSGVQVLLIVLAIALAAVLLQPLQLAMVRVFEGGFPRWLGSGLARKAQLRRKRGLEKKIQTKIDEAVGLGDPASADKRSTSVQEAGAISARLHSRFPTPDYLVRGTALGNALAAMEDSAPVLLRTDAMVAWPRLYPVLGDKVHAVVNDPRDGWTRRCAAATGALTAVAAVALLAWHSSLLTLLALVPLAVAVLAYLGALQSGDRLRHGGAHSLRPARFDLLRALLSRCQESRQRENATTLPWATSCAGSTCTFKSSIPYRHWICRLAGWQKHSGGRNDWVLRRYGGRMPRGLPKEAVFCLIEDVVGQPMLRRALEIAFVAPTVDSMLATGRRGTAELTTVQAFARMACGTLPVTLPIGATDDGVLGGWQVEDLMTSEPNGARHDLGRSGSVPEPGILYIARSTCSTTASPT